MTIIAIFSVPAWIRIYMANHTCQVLIGDVVTEEAAVPSGAPQGSVISPYLFLVMRNDLQCLIQPFCRLFADYTNMGDKSVDGWNLDKMTA